MKTFEEEYRELAEWYFSEREKLEGNAPAWDGVVRWSAHGCSKKTDKMNILYKSE